MLKSFTVRRPFFPHHRPRDRKQPTLKPHLPPRSRQLHGFRIPVFAALVCCLALFGATQAGAAAAPSIQATLGANRVITITGSDFPANAAVTLSGDFAGTPIVIRGSASTRGTFSAAMAPPTGFSGRATITARASRTGQVASPASSLPNSSNAPGNAASPTPSSSLPATTPSPTAVPAGGTCDQARIQQLVDSVSAANIEANLKELVRDDSQSGANESVSRISGTPGNKQKVQWMQQTLAGYGLVATLQEFNGSKGPVSNVIGTVEGKGSTNVYALTAHIDSNNTQDNSGVAPGANDDGSGIVAIMEAGRVLASFKDCMNSSVNIVGLNDEEFGMKGGPTYLNGLGNKTHAGGYNLDMVGNGAGKAACINNYYNSSKDKPLADRITKVNSTYNVNLTLRDGTYNSPDVDAYEFWQKGAALGHFDECNGGGPYHEPDDTTKYINYEQIALLTKLIVAATAELSMGTGA